MLDSMRKVGTIGALTVATAFAPALVSLDPSIAGPFRRIELLPWLVLPAVAIAAALLSSGRTKIDLSHPIQYVVLWYFAPFWILGATIFALGGMTHIPLDLIPNAPLHFRLATVYVAISVVAWSTGFNWHLAARAGWRLSTKLPGEQWSDRAVLTSGVLLVLLGTCAMLASFLRGNIGYQLSEAGDRFAALAHYLTLTFWCGEALVLFALFRLRSIRAWATAAAVVLLALTPVWMVLSGGRGFVVSQWLLLVILFFATGGEPRLRNLVVLGVIGVLLLATGVLYGTTFRLLKAGIITTKQAPDVAGATRPPLSVPSSSPRPDPPAVVRSSPVTPDDAVRYAQRRVSIPEQMQLAKESVSIMSERRPLQLALEGFEARLDAISPFAVLIANRNRLTPASPASLRDGIAIGLASAFVPRAFWPDKPVVGDIRSFGRLYFGTEANAFQVTPMGDLILNFGPLAVPAGMVLLGAFMRLLHALLLKDGAASPARTALYAVLLMSMSFEGFYGTIVPVLMRVAAIAVVALAVPVLLTRVRTARSAAPEAA